MIKNISIFNNKLAGFLMYKGFVLQKIGISKNSKERKLNIYYFNDNEDIKKSINEFKELHN